MTTHPNGSLPIVRVPADTDRAGALLDELDTLIGELDSALADTNAARLVISDAEMEMELIAASITLMAGGKNEAERKARLALALREDAGYQHFAATARAARASLFGAERRAAVLKQRIALVRHALGLLRADADA